jgi:hypothetical protein
VSDLPYARETVGKYDKACFFNPDDLERLTALMRDFMQGKTVYDETAEVKYKEPFVQNWNELVEYLLK